MNDETSRFSKNFLKNSDGTYDNPIKKFHLLEGKHFVVIDESIIERLDFSENDELYFEQAVTQEGNIILRPYKL